MAVLNAALRAAISAEMQRDMSNLRRPLGITKAQLANAIDAIDDQIEASLPAIRAAIPAPVRAALTAREEIDLIRRVFIKRFERE